MGIFSKKKDNEESARIYEEGMSYRGTDDAKAFEILTKAADLKNEMAEFEIGYMYENGIATEKDLTKAVVWYADSYDDGYYAASLYLMRIYIQGLDPEYDETELKGLIDDLLESHDISAFRNDPELLFEVANDLCNGVGKFDAKDYGIKLMQKGADLGIEKCERYFN